MKRAVLAGAVLVLLASQPAPARAAAQLQVSPAEVDFGKVTVGECTVVNDVLDPSCVTATVTITNVGDETFSATFSWSASTCQTLRQGSCITFSASWGAALPAPTSTCLTFGLPKTLQPGESCTVVLFAAPSRKGGIHGYFVMSFDEQRLVTVQTFVIGA